MPKVPSKCERGESSSSGVAQRPLDHCQRLRTRRARTRRAQAPASGSGTSSISRPKSDRGQSCSIQQQLRLFRMDTMDVDCHPCASKQEQIVKFACGEQGLGRAVARSKRSSWCKGRSGVRVRFATERRTVKSRGSLQAHARRSRPKTRSVARDWPLSDFPDRPFPARQTMYFSAELRRSSAPFVMYQ